MSEINNRPFDKVYLKLSYSILPDYDVNLMSM